MADQDQTRTRGMPGIDAGTPDARAGRATGAATGPGPGGRTRPDDRAVFVISVAAELAGVHPQTLRIYERKGLVRPKRTAANTRRYSERDIERLRSIQELTSLGVNLAGVARVIALEEEVERLEARIAELEQALEAQARRHHEELEAVRRSHRRDLVRYSRGLPLGSAALVRYQPPRRYDQL